MERAADRRSWPPAGRLACSGGGVDGAIHRGAGPGLLAECREIPELSPGVRCPTGEARLTGGHRLPARFVIHTVGPIWYGGAVGEPELLISCYRESLRLAEAEGLRSIAFPAISCGVYRYPVPAAAKIAVQTVGAHLAGDRVMERVILAAFDAATRTLLDEALDKALADLIG